MLAVDHSSTLEQSRAALLEEIGPHRELTLVRGWGNVGDELIRAGTHRLLDTQVFREVGIDELPACGGDTVLLPGSGAWCRPYHEWMPRALAIAELRFDRVIVLPSSFDVGEDSVRQALRQSRATVFARETDSLRQIEGLCRARFAHDCAFFYDYSTHRAAGDGTLNAFRTDLDAAAGEIALDDNDDISATAPSLDGWLAEIERHALIRTDRAHVMIAAALMGKQVEFAPNSYHKLEALAASWLREFPVRRTDPPRRLRANGSPSTEPAAATREQLRATAAVPPPQSNAATAPARVTAVVLTRDRPELALGAVRSVTATTVPVRALVIDNNSDPRARATLAALAESDSRIELRLADRNLGCAGGRRLAVELVKTEFVLFLDDDAELIDGALAHMLAEIDAHPEISGVTALVVGPQGDVQHCGGWMEVSDEAARFGLDGTGLRFDDPQLPSSGPSGWAPGTAALLRTQILREVTVADEMRAYYEDNDWCYRVEERRPGSFRRCREALVLHHHDFAVAPDPPPSAELVKRYEIVERLAAHAHFFRSNGVLLDVDLATLLPQLLRTDGSTDLAAARLLLELVAARGVDWTVMEWMNGGLSRLLEAGVRIDQLEADAAALRAHVATLGVRVAELEPCVAERDARIAALEPRLAALVPHAAGLEAQLAALTAHAAGLEAQLAALTAHAAGLETLLNAAESHGAALETQLDALLDEQAQTRPQIAWLYDRHLTLAAVEAGGWWRMRSRLLPLLRVAASVKRIASRRP